MLEATESWAGPGNEANLLAILPCTNVVVLLHVVQKHRRRKDFLIRGGGGGGGGGHSLKLHIEK